jgi:hypothetical protein
MTEQGLDTACRSVAHLSGALYIRAPYIRVR